MKGWKDKAKAWLNVLPASVLAVCIGISLSGYEPPVYEVEAAHDVHGEVEAKEPEMDTELDLDNLEIVLPPTASRSGPAAGASKTVEKVTEKSGYKDGTYYGTGIGFNGVVKVKVIVRGGRITDITVTESQDGTEYIKAASALLKNIIKKQSTNVDTVSGATYSSAGLIEAVRDALKDAGLAEKEKKNNKKNKKKTTEETTEAKTTETGEKVVYKDGIYYGTGAGFEGNVKVKVVVSDGRITDIQVTESVDGEEYIRAASALLADIIKAQSVNVDTVSGATYSSRGLIAAVKDALRDAVLKESETAAETSTETSDQTETNDADKTKTEEGNAIPEGKVPYKDGVYYGTGEGYKGDVTVAVVIGDHTIRYIFVTETADDEAFFGRAKMLLQTILQKQDPDVDTISGATFSSKGLIEAVKEALKAAKAATVGEQPDAKSSKDGGQPENNTGEGTEEDQGKETTDSGKEKPSDSGEADEEKETHPDSRETDGKKDENADAIKPDEGKEEDGNNAKADGSKRYQDGNYTMTVVCNPDDDNDFEPYTLAVAITIQDGKVVSVSDIYQVDGEEDNSYYVTRAAEGTRKLAGVAAQIEEKGNADEIDAVSGATCSSKAIIDAVRKMLEDAV